MTTPLRLLRWEVAVQLLREGQTVELPATGTSMRPLFCPGDRLRVRPARAADARPGDVVLIAHEGALVAHRLIWASATTLHTRGDAGVADEPWPAGALVGIVEVTPSPRALRSALRALFSCARP